MSVPLKSKLSYIWARATHKDRIYSHVFTKKVSIPVLGEFSNEVVYHKNGTISEWYKAAPMDAQPDQFLIYHCSYQQSGLFHSGPHHDRQVAGVYNREQVQEMFKNWDTEQMKLAREGVFVAPKQPFKAYIKTKLTP